MIMLVRASAPQATLQVAQESRHPLAREIRAVTIERAETITREALYRLIDELPDFTLPTVEQYLTTLRDDPLIQSLANAPLEDEELSEEEQAMLARAEEKRARGEARYVTSEELRREIGW